MACGFESRSWIFQNVMDALGVIVKNMPAGKDDHRVTACSKGKFEWPFRTVKEIHE